MKLTSLILGLGLSLNAAAANFEDFARAIGKVESGGNPKAVGDNGKARGIFQIHEVCFKDAAQFDRELAKFRYSDCFNPAVSKRVLYSYCARYESKALKSGDWETLARLWNSGPAWRNKRAATNGYWAKVAGNL